MSTYPERRIGAAMSMAAAWYFEGAAREAYACLRIALMDGGIERMRETIAVTGEERAELTAWARREPDLAARIEAAIRYRETVLTEFNRLTARQVDKNPPADLRASL